MKSPFFCLWAALALLVSCCMAWGESADSTPQTVTTLEEQAANGDPHAQYKLGKAYIGGQGLLPDIPKAVFWLGKSAEQGNAEAQASLGALYELGTGGPGNVRHDLHAAVYWYRKAAKQGLASAQQSLGAMYYQGRALPKDYAQAAAWFRRSAEQGDADGQNDLGGLYARGEGVSQDYAEAYFWLELASAGTTIVGSKTVIEARNDAASHLTETMRLQIQQRARKWLEDHAAKAKTQ
jgi:TPR repeat protein